MSDVSLMVLSIFVITGRVQLERMKRLRFEERRGRIAAESNRRKQAMSKSSRDGFLYRPIGFISSPFPDRRGTPRQPGLVPAASGKLVFDKGLVQGAHMKELSEFSHVWIIFVFHCNTNEGSVNASGGTSSARVAPPRLGGRKVGTLSTRSPHRPNNIGLSVCRVLRVDDTKVEIELASLDLVDGTPVLDIKPYIPYDGTLITPLIPVCNERNFDPDPSPNSDSRPVSLTLIPTLIHPISGPIDLQASNGPRTRRLSAGPHPPESSRLGSRARHSSTARCYRPGRRGPPERYVWLR